MLALLLLLWIAAVSSVPNIPPSELTALNELYIATNGTYWAWNANATGIPWNFTGSPNPCLESWQGVNCRCQSTCNVIDLSLNRHNLTGSLPQGLGNLTQLQTLVLGHNTISGTVPDLTSMPLLEFLELSDNRLHSPIPEWLGNMSSLEDLRMGFNGFYGRIPEFLFNMTNLTSLQFGDCLLGGTLSSAVGQLQRLTVLDFGFNNITGTLPSSLGSLPHLAVLLLDQNYIHGTIPESLGNASSLVTFSLTENWLHGHIPESVWALPNISTVIVGRNFLTGSISEQMTNMSYLSSLQLELNFFTGIVPESFCSNTALVLVYGFRNLFHSHLPTCFKNLQLLTSLDLHNNSFTGSVPVVGMPSMLYLDLAGNSFSGPLPASLWRELIIFDASFNRFTGPISGIYSSSIANNLILSLFDNHLSGTLPAELVDKPSLTYLSVANNHLTGTLPGNFSSELLLLQVFFNDNYFYGTLPPSMGNLSMLAQLDVSNNHFSGTYPVEYQALTRLQILSVANNNLRGRLDHLVNATAQTAMTNVDVSHNRFTGPIPIALFSLQSLDSFAASENCMTGTISAQICDAKNLTSLVLDGLSTAKHCRVNIFPNLPYFDSFTLEHTLSGTIPVCIFEITGIHTIHLNGNGLTGSLPSDLSFSSPLKDIALSHNMLEGTIPIGLQTRTMRELDLSYNRFDGTLDDDFPAVPEGGALFLNENRLSGQIPPALKTAVNISILEGNIFDCDVGRNQLPSNDPVTNIYVCGSSAINRSIYGWLFIIAVLSTISLGVGVRLMHTRQTTLLALLRSAIERVQAVNAFLLLSHENRSSEQSQHSQQSHDNTVATDATAIDSTAIVKLMHLFASIRVLYAYVGGFMALVLIPLYSGTTKLANTYRYEYAWQISAVLLKGTVAAVILALIFNAIFFVFGMAFAHIAHQLNYMKRFERYTLLNRKIEKGTLRQYLRITMVAVLNLIVMTAVDCTYVFIVLTNNAAVAVITQVAMAMFKIYWNEVALWKLIPLTKVSWSEWMRSRSSKKTTDTKSMATMPSIISNVSPMGVELRTNIVPEPVSVSVPPPPPAPDRGSSPGSRPSGSSPDSQHRERCHSAVSELSRDSSSIISNSRSSAPVARESARLPPPSTLSDLTHDDDGRGTILHSASGPGHKIGYNLADIRFVTFNTLLNNIIVPAVAIAAVSKNCFNNALIAEPTETDTYVIQQCVVFFFSAQRQDEECLAEELTVQSVSYDPPFQYSFQCASTIAMTYSTVFIFMFTIAGIILPALKVATTLTMYSISSSSSSAAESPWRQTLQRLLPKRFQPPTAQRVGQRILLFHKGKFAVRVMSYMAIIIAFGSIFPPVAIIGCLAMIFITYTEQYLIGSLLMHAENTMTSTLKAAGAEAGEAVQLLYYRSELCKQCSGATHYAFSSIKQIIPFSCVILGYLIFDTMGYANGIYDAMLVSFLFVVPLLILRPLVRTAMVQELLPKTWRVRSEAQQQSGTSKQEEDGGGMHRVSLFNRATILAGHGLSIIAANVHHLEYVVRRDGGTRGAPGGVAATTVAATTRKQEEKEDVELGNVVL